VGGLNYPSPFRVETKLGTVLTATGGPRRMKKTMEVTKIGELGESNVKFGGLTLMEHRQAPHVERLRTPKREEPISKKTKKKGGKDAVSRKL